MPSQQRQRPQPTPRRWYNDAVSAIAFFLLSYFLTRGAKNLFGGFPALFIFLITAGIGYAFARAAWRGLMNEK